MHLADYGFSPLASLVNDKVAMLVRGSALQDEPKTGESYRIVVIVVGLVLLAVGGFPKTVDAADADDEPIYEFSIPAQPLADALEALADHTGAMMIVPFELAESRRASPVVGHYTLPAALDAMLTGTGLSGDLSEKRVITVTAIEEEVMPSEKKGGARRHRRRDFRCESCRGSGNQRCAAGVGGGRRHCAKTRAERAGRR